MSMRRRMRMRRGGAEAKVDMNSLIDLTFLLLVVFIVTLPTLEQSVPIILPTDKVEEKKEKEKKPLIVTVDSRGSVFVGEVPTTPEDLKICIQDGVKHDPEDYAVIIRGDVRVAYGDIYAIFKIARDCNVKKLALVSKDE